MTRLYTSHHEYASGRGLRKPPDAPPLAGSQHHTRNDEIPQRSHHVSVAGKVPTR